LFLPSGAVTNAMLRGLVGAHQRHISRWRDFVLVRLG
jgi:hypothetical protein